MTTFRGFFLLLFFVVVVVFALFFLAVLVVNVEFAGLVPKQNTRVGPILWKRSLLQIPDRERTNQSTGICIRLRLPYNTIIYSQD